MAIDDAALRQRNKKAMAHATPLFDDLNSAWEKIEQFFRKQGILQPTHISYKEVVHWHNQVESEARGELLLGIQKHKGKWRICQGSLDYRDYEISSWTPVTDESVELRTELLEHVGKLYAKLVESNESFIPEIEKAVARSHSVLAELGIAKQRSSEEQ